MPPLEPIDLRARMVDENILFCANPGCKTAMLVIPKPKEPPLCGWCMDEAQATNNQKAEG